MSSQTDSSGGALDFLKWLAVLALVVAGVVGNYYYSSFDQSLLYRVLALLVLSAVAVAIALTTVKGRQFSGLMKESRLEIRKVVWPTRQELVQTTMIVVVFVLVVALMLWGLDSLVSWLVSGVIG